MRRTLSGLPSRWTEESSIHRYETFTDEVVQEVYLTNRCTIHETREYWKKDKEIQSFLMSTDIRRKIKRNTFPKVTLKQSAGSYYCSKETAETFATCLEFVSVTGSAHVVCVVKKKWCSWGYTKCV